MTVMLSPLRAVTRTISALVDSGAAPVAHTTKLNGTAGISAPVPAASTIVVPDEAGEGAVATVV